VARAAIPQCAFSDKGQMRSYHSFGTEAAINSYGTGLRWRLADKAGLVQQKIEIRLVCDHTLRQRKVPRERPLIAFFDYPDVFEDFYPHYGVDQHTFATCWADTGNHAFLSLLQREVGDVIWYEFSLRPELSEARHEVVGCRVKFLPSSWLHRCLWRAFYLPRVAWWWRGAYRPYATVASYAAPTSLPFLRALWRDRPDFFFVQSYSSGRFDILLLLARVLGVPLIARHAGGRPERYLGSWIRRWTLPRADRLIASGRNEGEMLASLYRVPSERLMVILTPIDTIAFRPLDRTVACQRAGLDSARRYLLFVGRLDDRVKRVSALIQAFAALAAEHRDVDLLVVGKGNDGSKLRRLAAELVPGRVRFQGWISGAEALAPLYSAAECLVLPSWREGFPAVVGEAMACGTPVLASHVGGVGELVLESQTGWLIPPGDDGALAAGLAFVLTHPAILAGMRPQARAMAEARVSPPVVAAALRQCFSINGK
jgi:glycosyltransferase involved in cell wall biosynthesis